MRKIFISISLICVMVLSGCSNNVVTTDTATTVDVDMVNTVVSNDKAIDTDVNVEESNIETTVETTVDNTEFMTSELITEEEQFEEVVETPYYWTDDAIQAELGEVYDLTKFKRTVDFERGNSKLMVYVEEVETMPVSLVLYCRNDGDFNILYEGNSMFKASGYKSENFVDYQNFDYTVYVVTAMTMGNCLPIQTWHLTETGDIIDLADTIDFETEFEGLYLGGIVDNDIYKTVIGLREQIPDTTAVGSSQLLPVTIDGEKIVKLDVEPIID